MGRVWYQLSEAAKRQSRGGASQAGGVHIRPLYLMIITDTLRSERRGDRLKGLHRQHSGGRSRQEG